MAPTTPHRWRFTHVGGFDQAHLEPADLARLGELDQKLWAALACPVKGLELDEKTLALIDVDGDGRVRAPEVLAAAQFLAAHVKDIAAVAKGADVVPLASIDERTETGRALVVSAHHVLKSVGKSVTGAVCLADVAEAQKLAALARFNGDGIVPVEAAEDEATKKAVADVVACRGGKIDRGGRAGVDQETLDAFFAEAALLDAWAAKQAADPALAPFGEGTPAAADARRAVRAKVDDWFARGRLAEFDPRSLAAVNREAADYLAAAAKDLSADAQEMGGFPLARVEPGARLPLVHGINPAWAAAVAALRDAVVTPLFGKAKASLSADEWGEIGAKLAPYEAWLAAKPATSVEKLGLPRVRELLAGPAKSEIEKLLAADKALAPEIEGLAQLERLVRYHRDLWRLLHNFVSFADFYAPDRRAVFEAGTLYLDSRACKLVVRVDDAAKHALLAGMSKCWLAYCDCTRPSGEKLTIAAAFTSGDSDYLMVGRNGLFYDRAGRDWDATITKVVENPISVRQAFWAPYKKLVRMAQEFAAKRAAQKDAEAEARMAAAAARGVDPAAAAAPPEPPKKVDVGTVAAIAVAMGSLGILITGLLGLFKAPFWQICAMFAGLVLLISGPSMLIAWLKLRQRNLGPILDANGWAVNARVKMSVAFGGSLTARATLPPGALPATDDPYAERPSIWPKLLWLVFILAFLWSFLDDHGWIYEWTDHAIGTPKVVVVETPVTTTVVQPAGK
jgi:hypothetical protein